ncbi:unnamed protein product, partial [marine sediment metagenome]
MAVTTKIELVGALSESYEDELGDRYRFKKGAIVSVPVNVAAVLLRKMIKRKPLFRAVVDS